MIVRLKEVLAFVTYTPSILRCLRNRDGDCFKIPILCSSVFIKASIFIKNLFGRLAALVHLLGLGRVLLQVELFSRRVGGGMWEVALLLISGLILGSPALSHSRFFSLMPTLIIGISLSY